MGVMYILSSPVQYTEKKLQHTIFIMKHLLATKSQTEIPSAVLLATLGDKTNICVHVGRTGMINPSTWGL